jgi:RNA polymerase sigma-70 factor, ECF subfamily
MTVRIQTETVWELLSAKLKSFIRSRVDTEQAAEDLLQEAFLRIHQRLDKLSDQERVESWVFQIARNLITDYYRERGRAPLPGDMEAEPAERPVEAEPDNHNQRIGEWLFAAIESLQEPHRQAMRMYEVEGVSQAEIAEKLGISLSGAKSRVQRGRRKLKRVLDRCCRIDVDRRGNVLSCEPKGQPCSACAP